MILSHFLHISTQSWFTPPRLANSQFKHREAVRTSAAQGGDFADRQTQGLSAGWSRQVVVLISFSYMLSRSIFFFLLIVCYFYLLYFIYVYTISITSTRIASLSFCMLHLFSNFISFDNLESSYCHLCVPWCEAIIGYGPCAQRKATLHSLEVIHFSIFLARGGASDAYLHSWWNAFVFCFFFFFLWDSSKLLCPTGAEKLT